MAFAIKAPVLAQASETLVFHRHKTMYGGKHVREGDVVFIFDSENEGGLGLWGRGRVSAAEALARSPEVLRQTPRVSLTVGAVVRSSRRLGRADLAPFRTWNDGRPETELNFKFYRQATNKLIGLSPAALRFLDGFFET